MKFTAVHIKYPAARVLLPVIILVFTGMISGVTMGQGSNMTKEKIIRKFTDYIKMVPREDVFVHTDREAYISGEELWFNIYLTDRQSMLPNAESRIVYLEILNPDNKPVIQKRIGIVKGYGAGQVELSDSLSSGMYLMRAYTSRMKNFLPGACFYKQIQIFNPDNSRAFKKTAGLQYLSFNEDKIIQDISRTRTGLAVTTDNSKPETLEIGIKADIDLLSKSGNRYFLFIQTHGVINFAEFTVIPPEGITVSVPKKKILPGINQITLISPEGLPVCEKYIYTHDISNSTEVTLDSENNFGKRSKITLGLTVTDSTDAINLMPNLSVSVSRVTGEKGPVQLHDYLIFGSEFGLVPHSLLNGLNIEELDSMVLFKILDNIRSNWIDWNVILSEKTIPVTHKYPVEKEVHELRGKLLNAEKQAAKEGEIVWMSIPAKVPVFQYATTDSAGVFSFPLQIDEEVNRLILQPENKSGNFMISVESPFSDLYPIYQTPDDTSGRKVPAYISEWSVTNQLRKIYEVSSYGTSDSKGILHVEPLRFYGKPDEEILMDNYIKLPDMEEVFFEIVNYVSLKKKNKGYTLALIDPTGLWAFDKPPTIMVDGVIINDADKIAAIDPGLVEKIDVILKKYIVGDYIFNGIVNVITRKGDCSVVALPENAVSILYRTIDQAGSFKSPDYSLQENKDSRPPDMRNTLFWNPSVRPGEKGKAQIVFWSSDIYSSYEINIQGITSEGKIISIRKEIKVEKPISGEVSSQAGK